MKVWANIETKDWNTIIFGLINQGWKITSKYNGFDAGIDFDFLILKKKKQKILFGWSNFEEGEIKCSKELIKYISEAFDVAIQLGKPINLKKSVILLTKTQILIDKIATISSLKSIKELNKF